MKGKINYSVTDGIAILEVDNPPVNPLSDGVRHGLIESMEKAESDDSVVGIVLTGKGRSFIAGADISEFGQQIEGPSIHDAFEKIEKSWAGRQVRPLEPTSPRVSQTLTNYLR